MTKRKAEIPNGGHARAGVFFEDRFLTLEERDGCIELVWKPGTDEMNAEGFKLALAVLAAEAIARHAESILVDIRQFGWRGALDADVEDWRQQTILPLYNETARETVKRFSYVFPAGADLPIEGTRSAFQVRDALLREPRRRSELAARLAAVGFQRVRRGNASRSAVSPVPCVECAERSFVRPSSFDTLRRRGSCRPGDHQRT